MDRNAPKCDGPRFPWLLLAFVPLLAACWTATALRHDNLERQGIDIVHHARMIHELQSAEHDAEAIARSHHAAYPRGSHRFAALFLPVFKGNAIQAMRCAALVALLVMLVAQYTLLRQFLAPAHALLTLVAWQTVCAQAQVADVNHFLWHGQYNYSRAVGAAALYLILVLLVVPAFSSKGRWLNDVAAVLLAVFALACHTGPGAIAFGTLGVYYLFALRAGQLARGIVGLVLTTLAGVGMVLGAGVCRYMTSYAGSDGWLPVSLWPLLMLWLPTWIAVMVMLWGRWSAAKSSAGLEPDFSLVLCCGLLVAGAFQAYLTYGVYVRESIAPYAMKSVLFYTFAFASLLWIYWIGKGVRVMAESNPWIALRRPPAWAVTGLAVVAAAAGLVVMLKKDASRPDYGSERELARVARVVTAHRGDLVDCLYFDPDQPFGSYFINSACLLHSKALLSSKLRRTGSDLNLLLAERGIAALLLPANETPEALFGQALPTTRIGSLLRCDLTELRSQATGAATQNSPLPSSTGP